MDLSLTGKSALVCGASSGIGAACATELAAQGASCLLLARSPDKLESVRAALPARAGQTHHALAADLASPQATRDTVAAWLARNPGPIHVVINNTGGPPAGNALDADAAQILAAINAQLIAAHMLAQLLVPGMKAARYGRILNITSTSVKQPIPGLAISNIVRPAVAAWAKCLSAELGSFGITVNNVLPGYTRTDRLASLFENRAKRQGQSLDAIEADVVASIPAARMGEPHEIAAAVAFLASPAGAYISGINLPVDGGRLGTL